MINSLPLTYAGDDTRHPEPITPAHLAIGRSLHSIPSGSIKKEDRGHVIQRFFYQQRLLNHFWKRWRQEYLQKLSIRNKWKVEQPSLEIGDVVLISDDNVQRGKWPMGRIIKVHRGKDGLICTATLQIQKGELRNPVQRLHRLEIQHNQVDRQLEKIKPMQTPSIVVPPETLPKFDEEVDLISRDQGGGRMFRFEPVQEEFLRQPGDLPTQKTKIATFNGVFYLTLFSFEPKNSVIVSSCTLLRIIGLIDAHRCMDACRCLSHSLVCKNTVLQKAVEKTVL